MHIKWEVLQFELLEESTSPSAGILDELALRSVGVREGLLLDLFRVLNVCDGELWHVARRVVFRVMLFPDVPNYSLVRPTQRSPGRLQQDVCAWFIRLPRVPVCEWPARRAYRIDKSAGRAERVPR